MLLGDKNKSSDHRISYLYQAHEITENHSLENLSWHKPSGLHVGYFLKLSNNIQVVYQNIESHNIKVEVKFGNWK